MKHENVKTSKAVSFFHKSKVNEENLEKILTLVNIQLPGKFSTNQYHVAH